MAYRASTLRGLAVAQMVFGALMIVFGLACIFAAHHWSSRVAFGVWVGSWVFVTGILGYVGARDDSKPNKCLLFGSTSSHVHGLSYKRAFPIGCYMGFSICACVIAGVMFICYAVTLSHYSKLKHCERTYFGGYFHSSYYYRGYDYCYSKYDMDRETAVNVAGLGSCLLIFSIVEFFLALAASIYCCAGVCCDTPSDVVRTTAANNQQVMFIPQQPQYMYPGAQGGMVLMQPSGAMTAMPQGYPAAGQPAVFVPSSQAGVPVQQPVFWAMPSGSNPAGAVTVSYAGAAGTQVQTQAAQVQLPKEERPPPYSFTQTGNATPLTASGIAPSEAVGSVDV